MSNNIIYFKETGKINTITTLETAKKRAQELDIKQVLIASSHGYTAKEAAIIFKGTGIELIAVTNSETYKDEGWCMTASERQDIERAGVKVLTSHYALGDGVAEAFQKEGSLPNVIARTLYCFSQGMKVSVEMAIMAAEAGLVPTDKEVIAIGGTVEGADTAIVLVPVCARKFKELRIREILSKPRIG